MYDVNNFKATDQAEVIAFMKAHPFITLCGVNEQQQPIATHVPTLVVEKNGAVFLQLHTMRKQLHTAAFIQHPQVLAIFNNTGAYISATWYEQAEVASTWNYQAVHAAGIARVMNDEELYQLLIALTNHFEGDENSKAAVKHMDAKYVSDNMKAIIGFEIALTQVQHVFKLSQNKNTATQVNIKAQLEKGDANAIHIATQMNNQHEKNR